MSYICSSSQGAMKTLNGYKINSSLGLECKDALHELGTHYQVNILWVLDHSGASHNQKPDECDAIASNLSFLGPKNSNLHFFKTHLKNVTHSYISGILY